MRDNKPDSQNICNAGEYYIASILSANGFTTTLTLGRAEKYDILAINPKGKTIKLQVKTSYGQGSKWRMNSKNEKNEERKLYYAFVRLNDLKKEPEFWIVPSKVVAHFIKEHYRKWLKTPGYKGQKHKKGDWRTFRIKADSFSPKNWDQKCKKYYKNIDLLLK